ncbi:MAG: flap endonuclease-1 [Promethearchaeota archaeon]
MGVKISDIVKPAATSITMTNLLGKRIAIDAFNSIFQFLATIRQPDGTPLKDYEGNITSHLSGLFYRTINLIEHDIKPVYIFDGPPHELKLKTIEERRQRRKEEKKKMEEAIDGGEIEDARKHAQATSKLTSTMIEESKDLLTYMGVPYVVAAHDGEAEAARLIISGDVWASSSQDYDSLLFGAKRLIRNLNINRKKKLGNTYVEVEIEYYLLDKVLETLKITQDQLIDIGILVGLDFFEGIHGVGEKTALKLIREYGSIEKIIENKVEIKKKPIEIDLDLLNKIRRIFKHIEKPEIEPNLKWSLPKSDKIKELLVEKHNFNKERIENALKRLIKKRTQKQQVSLDSFLARS